MITIKKILALLIISLIPAFLYEIAAVTFYCILLGNAPWGRVHQVAWSQDLVVILPVLCIAIFGFGVYTLFLQEEEPTISILPYESSRQEKPVL